ncbi:MAG: type II toxin-antitoxin system HicB family antitoxin [Acidimicrobiales bacterium]
MRSDDDRFWLVNVADPTGAHSFGRSLAEAKPNAVAVVALWLELEWDVQLGKLGAPVKRALTAMGPAEEDRRRRDEGIRALRGRSGTTRAAPTRSALSWNPFRPSAAQVVPHRTLTTAGVSYRDVGELLGLSATTCFEAGGAWPSGGARSASIWVAFRCGLPRSETKREAAPGRGVHGLRQLLGLSFQRVAQIAKAC